MTNKPRSRKPKRHTFILNPYKSERFTRCPKCDGKTKIRKRPFVVHVDPQELTIFNLTSPYCPACDLVILHQDKLETMLAAGFEQANRPEVIGNDYLVLGTVDRNFWQRRRGKASGAELIENLYMFKEVRTVEPANYGWAPTDKDNDDPQETN